MVYGRYNYIVNGVYKPTYSWGAPSCSKCAFLGDLEHHLQVFVGDYTPKSCVMFNQDIYQTPDFTIFYLIASWVVKSSDFI